jgi:fatty acid desaturase
LTKIAFFNVQTINKNVGIKELRDSIPAYCFTPSIFWSFFYLCRDLAYSAILIFMLRHTLSLLSDGPYQYLYYPVVISYGFIQGLVWTGLWVIAHECGHSAFSTNSIVNDTIGWTLHSALLAPYFSWKSTHRRHHIYAGHMDKDLNHVPLRRDTYAAKIGLKPGELDELGEDAPIVLFLRILLQQVIGWN